VQMIILVVAAYFTLHQSLFLFSVEIETDVYYCILCSSVHRQIWFARQSQDKMVAFQVNFYLLYYSYKVTLYIFDRKV